MNTTDWAVIAVIIDSIVTCFVGWRLNRTARQEATKAAKTVQPVIVEEINKAITTLLPLAIQFIQDKTEHKEEHVYPRAIQSIDDRHLQSS
jgi:hypothetical protein